LFACSSAFGQISGTFSVCEGSVTTLTCATPAGGTWSTSLTSIASVDGAGAVTGVAAGTATISYVLLPTVHTVVVTVYPLPAPITSSSFRICVGSSIVFSSATSGGTWISANTSIAAVGSVTGVVAGIGSGVTAIQYMLPTGCAVSSSVTVNPAPAAITGPTSVCEGGNVVLSHLATGGIWSSSNPIVATVSGSGIVSGLVAGTTMISYQLSSGCTVVSTVTVHTTPAPISGSAIVCSGSFSSLSSSPAGGSWSASGSAATVHPITGVVSAVSAGTVLVTYTLPATGCLVTRVVTVHPTPGPITGTAAICIGSSSTLSNTIAGGVWSSDAGSVVSISSATGSSISVSGLSVGTATVSYLIGSSCLSTVVVTVHPLTVPGVITGGGTPMCVGNTMYLSGSVSGGTWVSTSAGVASVGLVSGLVTSLSAGTTVISYAVSGFCGTVYTTSVVTVSPTPTSISGSSNLCLGAITLYTNGVAGGTWSSSHPSIASVGTGTGMVTGVNVGSAVITYELSSGCKAMQTINVTPAPSVITGASVVCAGSTENLINAETGGIWTTSSPVVATVAVGGGVTGVVLGLSAGTSTITYAIGACIATHVMTVYPLPAVVANAYPVACGATYTTLATGAESYSWSPSAGLSCDNCPNPTCVPVGTTSYTITGTSISGCTNITIVTVPGNRISGHVSFGAVMPSVPDLKVWLIEYNAADSTIASVDSVLTCMDGTIPYYQFSGKPDGNYYIKAKLLSSVPGTNNYIFTYGSSSAHWSLANTINHVGNAATQDIDMLYGTVPTGPGLVRGFVYSGAGKGTSGDVPVEGLLVYLKNALSGNVVAYTYTDSLGAYSFSGLGFGNYLVYPEEYGYYTTPSTLVELIAANYLISNVSFRKSTTFRSIYPYSYTGVKEVAEAGFVYDIYPNPANGVVYVVSGKQTETKVVISDISGRVELVNNYSMKAGEPIGIDIGKLSEGLHIVTVISGDIRESHKLVVSAGR